MSNSKEPSLRVALSLYWEWFCSFVKGNFSVATLLLVGVAFLIFKKDYGIYFTLLTILVGFSVAFYDVWANERRKVISLQKAAEVQGAFSVEQRREFRNRVSYLLDEGKGLQLRCRNQEENQLLNGLTNDWGSRTADYLGSIERSFRSRFNAPPQSALNHTAVPTINRAIWRYIDVRLIVLREILKELA